MKKDGFEYVCPKCGTRYNSIKAGPHEKSIAVPKISTKKTKRP